MVENISDEALLHDTFEKVLTQFIRLAEQTSISEGPGINIFNMIPLVKVNDKQSNCVRGYAPKNERIWDFLLSVYPYREQLKKLYDPTKHFLIDVNIKLQNDETLHNIRMFEFNTHKEVSLFTEN
jgi:hypothetical protein